MNTEETIDLDELYGEIEDMTDEELNELNELIANGVEKLRITGGEPLVRRQIENLIEKQASHIFRERFLEV